MRPLTHTAAVLLGGFLLVGCGEGEAPQVVEHDRVEVLPLGEDRCPHCQELVDELRFGGELVTAEGETLRFRSVECLAGYLLENGVDAAAPRSLQVVDFNHGRRLIDAPSAVFVHSEKRSSPHGLSLLALPPDEPDLAFNVRFAWGGELLDWRQVLELVDREWRVSERAGR